MILNKKILDQVKKEIFNNNTFFIAGHLRPDGDTIGTSLALASVLRRLGKKTFVYSKDPLPNNLKSVPGASKIMFQDKVTGKYDCAIILECADFERMGNLIDQKQAGRVVNIDHHAHFNNFGDVNLINPEASSSAEQVYNIFKHMKIKLTVEEAECLYVGLVTDTGRFQQANTTSSALQMASDLVSLGVKTNLMYDKLYADKTLSSLKLLGCSLNTLTLDTSGKIAMIEITKAMYKKTSSNALESDEIINYAMAVSGVVVGALFREDGPDKTKISFRSRYGFDVNRIAKQFQGGGHKSASGCTFNGNIKRAKNVVLKYLRQEIAKHK